MWGRSRLATTHGAQAKWGADAKWGNAVSAAKFRNSATVPTERMGGRCVQPALVAGVFRSGGRVSS